MRADPAAVPCCTDTSWATDLAHTSAGGQLLKLLERDDTDTILAFNGERCLPVHSLMLSMMSQPLVSVSRRSDLH